MLFPTQDGFLKYFAVKGATEVDEAGKLIYAGLLRVCTMYCMQCSVYMYVLVLSGTNNYKMVWFFKTVLWYDYSIAKIVIQVCTLISTLWHGTEFISFVNTDYSRF